MMNTEGLDGVQHGAAEWMLLDGAEWEVGTDNEKENVPRETAGRGI